MKGEAPKALLLISLSLSLKKWLSSSRDDAPSIRARSTARGELFARAQEGAA